MGGYVIYIDIKNNDSITVIEIMNDTTQIIENTGNGDMHCNIDIVIDLQQALYNALPDQKKYPELFKDILLDIISTKWGIYSEELRDYEDKKDADKIGYKWENK
jgi:hypothetical protein